MTAADDPVVGGWERHWVLREGWRNLPPIIDPIRLGTQLRTRSAGSWLLRFDGAAVACVTLYDYQPLARRAWLSVVTAPHRSGIAGLLAAAVALEGVFALSMLDRMWIEIPAEIDSLRVRTLQSYGFSLHGVLAACAYQNGEWTSRSVLACSGDDWHRAGSPRLHARWGDVRVTG